MPVPGAGLGGNWRLSPLFLLPSTTSSGNLDIDAKSCRSVGREEDGSTSWTTLSLLVHFDLTDHEVR